MKYIEFEQNLAPFLVFSIDDIRKKAPRFDTRRLVEWQEKNYIQKIINKWYMFSKTELTEELLFLVANRIYDPSYVSFETSLSWHGLIPEAVFAVISATSKKTRQFRTTQGTFMYRRLKPALLFGYRLENPGGFVFKMAEPEKAILDYLYLHPKLQYDVDFETWRINIAQLNSQIDRNRLEKYLTLFSSRALTKRVAALLKFADHA